MALTGTYTRTLDDKQRLAIPKPLRDAFDGENDGSCYIAPGTEQSLSLYPAAGFEALAQKFAQQSRNQRDVRNYLRLFYARAEHVTPDSQGRIRIPERLITLAGLKHEIVVLGVQDHAEIWDASAWNDFLENHSASFDELASQALDWT